MDITENLIQIKLELAEIKQALNQRNSLQNSIAKWIPIKEVMNWLNYGPTQMSALIKSNSLTVSRVGKRKFILKESLDKLLEKNKINPTI